MLHLIIDGYTAYRLRLQDVALIENLVLRTINFLGMHLAMGPYTQAFGPPGAGVTSSAVITTTAILMESHIIIHTFPEAGRIFLDIATCQDPKTVDIGGVVLLWQEGLGLMPMVFKKILRGVELDMLVAQQDALRFGMN